MASVIRGRNWRDDLVRVAKTRKLLKLLNAEAGMPTITEAPGREGRSSTAGSDLRSQSFKYGHNGEVMPPTEDLFSPAVHMAPQRRERRVSGVDGDVGFSLASAEQAAREAVGSRLPSGSVAAHGALYGGHVAEIDSRRASVRAAALEAFVFKGGWLYKLRDKFPRRWQRRYFALTRDYRLLYFKQPPHDARDLEQPQGAVDLHGCKWGVLPEEAASPVSHAGAAQAGHDIVIQGYQLNKSRQRNFVLRPEGQAQKGGGSVPAPQAVVAGWMDALKKLQAINQEETRRGRIAESVRKGEESARPASVSVIDMVKASGAVDSMQGTKRGRQRAGTGFA